MSLCAKTRTSDMSMSQESTGAQKRYGTELFLTHRMLAEWIRPHARVLEVGCSSGAFAQFLHEEKGCTVVGIEANSAAAAAARAFCERVVCGDAEIEATWREAEAGYDFVVFADTLEHLRFPEDALRRSVAALSPGGAIAIAVPNVAFYPVRLNLLRGHFDYTEYGVLDNTHLRFFTRSTLIALTKKCDLTVLELVPELLPIYGERLSRKLGVAPLKHFIDRVVWRLAPGATALKWHLLCSPTPLSK
jgi:2-polyprenyl-3-methyl-5-hydroxy-6-metoxy-1,4-benzoquinol methylase